MTDVSVLKTDVSASNKHPEQSDNAPDAPAPDAPAPDAPAPDAPAPYHFSREAYERRVAWFVQARFGVFLHWGLYAIPARGEWVRSDEHIPDSEYRRYFDEFNPHHADMHRWMEQIYRTGARYVVMCAKHHDGFCLFDSAYTDFKSTNTAAGRDFVAEYLDAARDCGLKAGLYYSLLDWHHHDYPHVHDRHHPMRADTHLTDEGRVFDRYLDYMHAQVRELCSNYGKLDLLWFDFSYDEMRAETWRATELMRMVRSLQPDVVVNNRLEVSGEGFGSLAACKPTPYHGDFITPEQIIPPRPLLDVQGQALVWESCVTLNNHWGYCARDRIYKPASLIIKKLVECTSKGGNLLVNVGPDAQGRFPWQADETLAGIGTWMKHNASSIYGCGPSGLEKPEYGRITRRGNTLYFHLFENTIGPVPLFGVDKECIDSVRLLEDGSDVPLSSSWVHSDYPDLAFADLGTNPYLPDPVDTVLEVRLR